MRGKSHWYSPSAWSSNQHSKVGMIYEVLANRRSLKRIHASLIPKPYPQHFNVAHLKRWG